jgi:hypothetical protein
MTTPATRHAECSCGQLRVAAEGEPVRISICHCLACQRRTGSAFGVQARFRREHVRFEGRASEYVRTADSGNRSHQAFCPECGSTVYYWLDDAPDLVAIAVGAFADPAFPTPRFSVYESRRHAWAGVPDELEHKA